MRRALLLAVLLAATTAGTARAHRWQPVDVQRAMLVADNHWPASPCYGAHDLHWVTGAELDAIFDAPDGVAGGDEDGQTCRVWVAWDRVEDITGRGTYAGLLISLCSVLEHEYGHNAGVAHSDDPNNIMYPRLVVAGDCRLAFATVHYRWFRSSRWGRWR